MNKLIVGPGVQVTLHFSLKLQDGTVVDSNFDGKPATFVVGDGNMIPGFEKVMHGFEEGDTESFVITPEQGFGQHNPSNVQAIDRDQFPEDVELSQGLMLNFADAKSNTMPGVVREFNDKEVTIDFNHPLAGREIVFDIHILSLAPAVKH